MTERSKPGALVVLLAGIAASDPALAQSTAPSSIVPQTLRPTVPSQAPSVVSGPEERATAPADADALTVRLSSVEVEGTLPRVRDEVAALVAPFAGRTVSLTQIYALAAAIEAAHVRAGYVLARVAVPPQTLRPGGPVRLLVVDGFVEAVDVSGLPRRVRAAAARRTAALVGARGLRTAEIEQPLLIAGELPGLRLTSTLARGTEVGGTRLLLAGRQSPISGSVSADNGYAASLGRYGVTAQLSLNSLAGLGEQVYGFVSSGYDPRLAFGDDAPVRVLGGGFVLPSGNGRAFINPEVTFARTQPMAQADVPRTRGRLRRLSLRGGFTVARSRRQSFTVGATVEHVRESNDAIDFATRLSLDRFFAGRLRATFSRGWAAGGGVVATAQLSHGLGGTDASRLADDVDAIPTSRQGASAYFTKLDGTLHLIRPLPHRFQLSATIIGQTSFGEALFRSEQGALEGADALSAYVGGITAVDESVTGRLELSRGVALPGVVRGVGLAPYLFAAAGQGWLDRPTALEDPRPSAENLGAGVRGSIAATGIGFGIEYARGFSPLARLEAQDRVSGSLTLSF